MTSNSGRDLICRFDGNPILTQDDIPFPCNSVFNAAAARYGDQVILLLRVEDLGGRSVFALARSGDGRAFTVDDEPAMVAARDGEFAKYEAKGIEDPRITPVDGTYYITYTAASGYGPRLALAKTDDFVTFERVALISEPDNKDGVLFPRQIGGRYVRLDRPMTGDVGNVWISYSDDLIHWGHSRVVLPVRADCWDSWRVGASAPPIETQYGWLEIYHGVRATSHGLVIDFGPTETKTHRYTEHPVPRRLKDALRRYIAVYRPLLLGDAATDRLWLNRHGRPMNDMAVYRRLVRLG